MTGDVASLDRVRELLERTLTIGGGILTAQMREQIAALRGTSGPITMLDLDVPVRSVPIDLPDGPYEGPNDHVRIGVKGDTGADIGGIILWIEKGKLATFEYFWYTDQPPSKLPRPEQLYGWSSIP